MATYGPTVLAPRTQKGFLVRPEASVWLGTHNLWGSLETSSETYSTYDIPIGLDVAGGKAIHLGILESLSFAYTPTMEAMESVNMSQGVVYDLTGEELTVSTGVREFKPEVLQAAINNGVMYTLQDEVVFVFGGECVDISRPLMIMHTNKHCSHPTSEGFYPSQSGDGTTDAADVGTGYSGGVLTVFDATCTSGLPWDSISRQEVGTLALEWAGRPSYHSNFTNKGNLASWWVY